MISGYDDRYGNKASLQNLNDQATALNYNRTLYPEAIDRLPADEIFAIAPIMVHKHSQGRAVDPHLRCSITSVTGQTDFGFALIDVPIALFELLPKSELNSDLIPQRSE